MRWNGLARGGSVVLAAAMLAVTVSAPPAERATTHAPASRPLYTTQAPIAMPKVTDLGAILFARGTDNRFIPASMAKVFTASVVPAPTANNTRPTSCRITAVTYVNIRGGPAIV